MYLRNIQIMLGTFKWTGAKLVSQYTSTHLFSSFPWELEKESSNLLLTWQLVFDGLIHYNIATLQPQKRIQAHRRMASINQIAQCASVSCQLSFLCHNNTIKKKNMIWLFKDNEKQVNFMYLHTLGGGCRTRMSLPKQG